MKVYKDNNTTFDNNPPKLVVLKTWRKYIQRIRTFNSTHGEYPYTSYGE